MVTQVMTILGARPQFIKAAVVSRAFQEYGTQVRESIVHTGQHFDSNMSDVFFDELHIPRPDHHLGIGGGSHGQNTGRMIEAIEALLLKMKPEWVLVYGDTDSTLAGALAASKLHIPVAHVEAGLRSFNQRMPEEINRVLTDHVSQLLFTPTVTADHNLLREGIERDHIRRVGDVMYDAALYYSAHAQERSSVLGDIGLESKAYVLATIHRAENTDDPKRLSQILNGLSEAPYPVVWPLHPRTRKRLANFGLNPPHNIKLIDPVGYLDMVMLEKHSLLIATDSGGVQKEAYFHGVPCITLREETEWVETVESGWNRLVGCRLEYIVAALQSPPIPGAVQSSLYGDGHAGLAIASSLSKYNGGHQ